MDKKTEAAGGDASGPPRPRQSAGSETCPTAAPVPDWWRIKLEAAGLRTPRSHTPSAATPARRRGGAA